MPPLNQIITADARTYLQTMPADSIDCVVTSPPYWGLRDYGHAEQLGLESDYKSYITDPCDIFDEIRRVLKPTGTVWVNLGDSYSGSNKGFGDKNDDPKSGTRRQRHLPPAVKTDVPAKSLLQIPSRFALAMVERGWILRNEIIWQKPNAMPESVRDRFTTDHEKIFLFVKRPQYYFDQEAVLVPVSRNTHARMNQDVQHQVGSLRANGGTRADRPMKTVGRKFDPGAGNKNNPSFDQAMAIMPSQRNMRTVWRVGTKGFKGAHFATFPEELVLPMIKAGCPEDGVVLDPFFGAGTTGLVARRLGRSYIGIEINPEYVALAEKRLAQGSIFEKVIA